MKQIFIFLFLVLFSMSNIFAIDTDLDILADDYITIEPGLDPGSKGYYFEARYERYKYNFINFFSKEKGLKEALKISDEKTAEIIYLVNSAQYQDIEMSMILRNKYISLAESSLASVNTSENYLLFNETVHRQNLAIQTMKTILQIKLYQLQRSPDYRTSDGLVAGIDSLNGGGGGGGNGEGPGGPGSGGGNGPGPGGN